MRVKDEMVDAAIAADSHASWWAGNNREGAEKRMRAALEAALAVEGAGEADEKRAIGNGMAIAAGIVMKCWGDTVTAGEILGAAGYHIVADLKKDGVDQYDIDLVKPALRGQS